MDKEILDKILEKLKDNNTFESGQLSKELELILEKKLNQKDISKELKSFLEKEKTFAKETITNEEFEEKSKSNLDPFENHDRNHKFYKKLEEKGIPNFGKINDNISRKEILFLKASLLKEDLSQFYYSNTSQTTKRLLETIKNNEKTSNKKEELLFDEKYKIDNGEIDIEKTEEIKHLTGVSGLSQSSAYNKINKLKNGKKENENSIENVEEVDFEL